MAPASSEGLRDVLGIGAGPPAAIGLHGPIAGRDGIVRPAGGLQRVRGQLCGQRLHVDVTEARGCFFRGSKQPYCVVHVTGRSGNLGLEHL